MGIWRFGANNRKSEASRIKDRMSGRGGWKRGKRGRGEAAADPQAPAGLPPLAAGLAAHAGQGYLGFHMPGHHQGRSAWAPWRQLLGEAVFSLDLTELPGLDNLQDPQGVIRSAAAEAASCFGAAETSFLVNGASAGILAVLLATCREGDRVLLPRNCHQSVVHGLVLSGAAPVYLPVRWHPGLGLPGMLQTGDLEEALAAAGGTAGCPGAPAATGGGGLPDAAGRPPGRRLEGARQPGGPSGPGHSQDLKLLVLLHPNYYGLTGEIAEQIALAHRYGLQVLVDEAHGAHFCAGALFPPPGLKAGADYAVHGVHKTLGAFTQAAMLHCRERGATSGRIGQALRLVQTSSPSYLLLASLDVARLQLQQSGEGWEETGRLGLRLRREISRIPGLLAPGEELLEAPGVVAFDPARLVVNVSGLGVTGFAAAGWLRDERRILAEMADPVNLVFILTPGDTGPAAEVLLEGLQALARSCGATGARNAACGQSGGGFGGDGGYMIDGAKEGSCGTGGYGDNCGYAVVDQGEGSANAGGYGAFCGQQGHAGGSGSYGQLAMLPEFYDLPVPRQTLTPRQAFFAPCRQAPLEAAAGKIAAVAITPYPPGIPVICPGEVIDDAVLECLAAWRRAGGSWPGMAGGTIAVVDGS